MIIGSPPTQRRQAPRAARSPKDRPPPPLVNTQPNQRNLGCAACLGCAA